MKVRWIALNTLKAMVMNPFKQRKAKGMSSYP